MKFLTHFSLYENPFQNNLFFERKETIEAMERMELLTQTGGIMHLYGQYGVGKTVLLNKFTSELNGNIQPVLINYTSLAPFCFFLKLSHQLGLKNRNNTANLVTQISNYIEKDNSNFLFIIDEAQNLYHDTIEAIKLIINPYLSNGKLSLIISSHPDMKDSLINSPAFKQRINFSYLLPPLNLQDSKLYFLKKLEYSKCPDIIFRDVIDIIIKKTDGLPRLINNFATQCLISAASSQKKIIDKQTIENVTCDLII